MKLYLEHHYATARTAAEARAVSMLTRQERSGPHRGGFINPTDGMAHPGAGTGSLLTLIPVLVDPESTLAGSTGIVDGILLALEYGHDVQRDDGTFDLLPSNFYSSPDNGFIMHNLARCYRILTGAEDRYPEIEESLYDLIVKTGRGMVGGGFHTPNHRWVIAAALAMAHNISGDAEMLEEANRYLAEGIDIDEEGEFTERSSGIYNAVNDNALMILAEELDDDTLLDPVAKNLEMMFSYLEPDGSLFTWNSTRQDKGEGAVGDRFMPVRYYDIYLAMLRRRFDPRYAWIVEEIHHQTAHRGGPGAYYRFVLEPELKRGSYEIEPPVDSFDHFYPRSRIARLRRESRSITVLAGSSNFLFVQSGSVRCRVKLCASFFSVAQFRGESLERTEHGYRLRFETHADYRLPLDPPPESPMWAEMDHAKRTRVKDQVLTFEVLVREIEHGVELTVASLGCTRVPVKLEFVLTPGTVITGEHFALPGKPGGSITVGAGMVTAREGNDSVTIGPGFSDHWFSESMRGSEPQAQHEFTLYFTGFTPIERTITITSEPG